MNNETLENRSKLKGVPPRKIGDFGVRKMILYNPTDRIYAELGCIETLSQLNRSSERKDIHKTRNRYH